MGAGIWASGLWFSGVSYSSLGGTGYLSGTRGPWTLSLDAFLPFPLKTCLTRPSQAASTSTVSPPCGSSSSSGRTSSSSMTGTAQAPLATQSCSKVGPGRDSVHRHSGPCSLLPRTEQGVLSAFWPPRVPLHYRTLPSAQAPSPARL